MHKINPSKIISITAFVLAGFIGCLALADTQSDRATVSGGSGGCAGTYYAVAKMTNSSGTFWITPPPNTHTGTFTNASGFPHPFSSVVTAIRKLDQQPWCGTNSVTFPATNSSYTLTVYVTTTVPPPTNNQPMTLEVIWQ
jgi:hypothetical protein